MIYKKKRGDLAPSQSSLVLDLKPILALRQVVHPSTFLIKAGLNNATVTKMLKGEMVQLNFRQMSTLCLHLNCTPNDLMARRDMVVPESHELNKIRVLSSDNESIDLSEWAKTKTLDELKAIVGMV